jgi:uncharacterized protein (TIGR01777 family)
MIAITGASGFIGEHLMKRLQAAGRRVRVLGRSRPEGEKIEYFRWDTSEPIAPPGAFENCTGVVHLAGESMGQRWNADVKARIRTSRIEGTRSIVRGVLLAGLRPPVLVCASATGFYGDRGEDELTESAEKGTGFLADVTAEWEAASRDAVRAGIRVVNLRSGVVLGKSGALQKMLTPFRLGVGGPIGSGRQWMPWIYIGDLVDLILFSLSEERVSGPVNAAAGAVRNIDFTKALGAALHRPAFMPVPLAALKLLYGEMAGVMVASQRVVPETATRAGFRFRHDKISGALERAIRDEKSN